MFLDYIQKSINFIVNTQAKRAQNLRVQCVRERRHNVRTNLIRENIDHDKDMCFVDQLCIGKGETFHGQNEHLSRSQSFPISCSSILYISDFNILSITALNPSPVTSVTYTASFPFPATPAQHLFSSLSHQHSIPWTAPFLPAFEQVINPHSILSISGHISTASPPQHPPRPHHNTASSLSPVTLPPQHPLRPRQNTASLLSPVTLPQHPSCLRSHSHSIPPVSGHTTTASLLSPVTLPQHPSCLRSHQNSIPPVSGHTPTASLLSSVTPEHSFLPVSGHTTTASLLSPSTPPQHPPCLRSHSHSIPPVFGHTRTQLPPCLRSHHHSIPPVPVHTTTASSLSPVTLPQHPSCLRPHHNTASSLSPVTLPQHPDRNTPFPPRSQPPFSRRDTQVFRDESLVSRLGEGKTWALMSHASLSKGKARLGLRLSGHQREVLLSLRGSPTTTTTTSASLVHSSHTDGGTLEERSGEYR
ncbi:putative proline-rich protein 21 [Penaeus vannamei]|uniref:putative proline-rich protein 21 n=1 Tax=Penaeus vannamei TaxID=6689 RepID=UPI00387F6ECC